ncbi:rhamnosyltransferase [Acinetobacter baumannii Naval-72]|uniref:glycosyltransferase family 2 protein n=1 Tax=Acinetobacter baumannii TaxID=470 RepID=UPI00028D488A|nr:glycosyltransferase family 2 protein [Acinetobacter baumannii]EKK08910.1 rhamnosyltransferase [Acinetobacter baumannii Naval-72]MBJ9482832.1 glycosyltransferase family 2 protein [Acinetobacter baumannii]MBJ9912521.1 glycosyltransferase family 2 protein [Acinetobacter baumannii]MBJ9946841.1 glycosyltransferase family 2 protein [Acinetobacter baumannii]
MIVFSVIVTFNPSENIFLLVKELAEQNVLPIVVDNGSKDFNFSDLIDNPNICFIGLDNNLGIASAQNIGIKKALELGAEYILFFDQDSVIYDGFVRDIVDDYQLILRENSKIGAIGPRFIDGKNNFYYKAISISKYGLRVKYNVSEITKPFNSILLISSGSLISVNTLKKVGLMKDKYFIDYVDTEWCMRSEALGYKNYMSSKAIMRHTIGDNIKQTKYFTMPIHSSFRRYYIIRNSFYMLKEPHIPTIFVLHQLVINVIHQFLIIYMVKGRRLEYMKSFINGFKDGLKIFFK